MNVVLRILNEPDPCALAGLIALLAWVGSCMVANRPDLRLWGYRLAAAAFVGYGLYGIAVFEPVSADQFLGIAVRALFAAGWALGVSWIGLSILGFVGGYIRSLQLRQRKPEWKPAPVLLPAVATVRPTVTVMEAVEPERKPETIGEKIAREKSEYEDRLAALSELRVSGVIDDDMLAELQANELERFTRQVTNVLGYRPQ